VVFVVFFLGGMTETLAMVGLTWMYNDLEGADENYIVRNIINAFGFVCYSSGATIVAAGYGEYDLNQRLCLGCSLAARRGADSILDAADARHG
jgi:hypothetical protein